MTTQNWHEVMIGDLVLAEDPERGQHLGMVTAVDSDQSDRYETKMMNITKYAAIRREQDGRYETALINVTVLMGRSSCSVTVLNRPAPGIVQQAMREAMLQEKQRAFGEPQDPTPTLNQLLAMAGAMFLELNAERNEGPLSFTQSDRLVAIK